MALFVLLAAGKIVQMKRNRPDMGIGEQLRLRNELKRKNEALLKQREPEALQSCILAWRELVEQAVGVDRIVYTINLAERLYANGELDEAAALLDSIALKIKGRQMKLVYWHNRAALEISRQNEGEAKKLISYILENMEKSRIGKKNQEVQSILYLRVSMWQAVLEKRYEEALLLLDKLERTWKVRENPEAMQYEKQYFLMERLNIYLKMNKMEEAWKVEEKLKQEKRYPLIDWWLERQGM